LDTSRLESKPDLLKIQDEILGFWAENNTFAESVDKPAKGEVVFYDGPPFPTGKPHHGTVLVSFIKDMIARYHTMRGYSVPRVWGWDCHGLPIENQAEKLLGITDKNLIEQSLGIDKFNDKCREIVSGNDEAWREYIQQMARWVDYDNAYKTMSVTFMESVMWAFKQCYEKGLIYQDYRVTPYCCHCETSLSVSDTRESDSTRPRQDRWALAKFKTTLTCENLPVYFCAWTTTPWTLPSNMALAVGENLTYAFVKVKDAVLVAGETALSQFPQVFGKTPEILKTVNGRDLAGTEYTPLFPYFAEKKAAGAFRVIIGDFVTAEDGVGIVHIAPAFGEDDYWACKKHNVPLVNPVDSKGRFTEAVSDFYNIDGANGVKNVIELNSDIIRFMYANDLALADGTIEHNYPHCWRCKNPLIYKAMDAWYFSIDTIKNRLIELNEDINWVPDSVKHGRFGQWLENARDWNISRNRYWSTPIPIWECDCCHARISLGSIAEIEEKSSVRLTDLHRQYMDKIVFACENNGCSGTMRRISEVLDCWFESGSVPFAQKHYPFENKDWFETHLPSDFIVEYTGQIRCWFYYLHVMSVALFDKVAFKNCIVHGTVLDKTGKKLSKSSKNYTDPMELMRTFGTDAFRLYMYQSNAMLVGDLLFDEAGVKEALQKIILPLWNASGFYLSYAEIDQVTLDPNHEPNPQNTLDKWILAKLYDAEKGITENMEAYQIDRYTKYIYSLIDGLTNWYIRRSRRRFWEKGMNPDKRSGYETLYYVLVNICRLCAPIMPIITEKLYKHFTSEESVHLAAFPNIPEKYRNDELLLQTETVEEVINLARSIRSKNNIKNRIPLSKMVVVANDAKQAENVRRQSSVICEEVNVKLLEVTEDASDVATINYLPNFKTLKTKFGKQMPIIADCVRKGNFTRNPNGGYAVNTADGEISLDNEDILVTYHAKGGGHIANSANILVVLDLTLTKELKREGLARDIVRNIQDARKQMGCDIMDRITVAFEGDYPEEFADYILSETLADKTDNLTQADSRVELALDDGQNLIIKIKK
jgi:isoleucyl-tRNA synthetase